MLVVLPALGGGLLGLGLIAAGFSVGSGASIDLGPNFGPRHLKPIAIPKTACPYLKAVNVTAGAAQAFWNEPSAFNKLGTPASDRQLEAVLAPFDFSLRVAATQVPARLRLELSDTAHQVEIGRASIAYGRVMDTRFILALAAGLQSLNNASDLVGHACGFPLAA
jgi:hypothetical protein